MIKEEQQLHEIKPNDSFYYSFNSSFINNTPFLTLDNINKLQVPILLDTGAYLMLIPTNLLINTIHISKTNRTAKAANGEQIPIVGKIYKLIIRINNQGVIIKKTLVTPIKLKYILLGAPEISNTPELILKIIQSTNHIPWIKKDYSLEHNVQIQLTESPNNVLLSQEVAIRKKFLDIFASEITAGKLCTIKKHSINTGNSPPICQKERYMHMHLIDKVKEELTN